MLEKNHFSKGKPFMKYANSFEISVLEELFTDVVKWITNRYDEADKSPQHGGYQMRMDAF